GVHVRGGDVAVVADEDRDLRREASRHVLELVLRKVARVHDDAALRAAERDVDDGALPRHPHRERLDLVQRHVRVVADAALGRAAVDVVLDAIAGEHPDARVVEPHRERARELALHLAQDLSQPRLELDDLGGLVELGLGCPPLVGFYDRLGWCAHIRTDDRGYSAAGSQITLRHAGRPLRNARSSAGRMSPGRSTISPYPPSASTTLS